MEDREGLDRAYGLDSGAFVNEADPGTLRRGDEVDERRLGRSQNPLWRDESG